MLVLCRLLASLGGPLQLQNLVAEVLFLFFHGVCILSHDLDELDVLAGLLLQRRDLVVQGLDLVGIRLTPSLERVLFILMDLTVLLQLPQLAL